MADREKVLSGIEHHTKSSCFYNWSLCPYAGYLTGCIKRLLADVAELLKDQEPVPVEVHEKDEWHCRDVASPDRVAEWIASASNTPYYCPGCGRRVVWEVTADGRA